MWLVRRPDHVTSAHTLCCLPPPLPPLHHHHLGQICSRPGCVSGWTQFGACQMSLGLLRRIGSAGAWTPGVPAQTPDGRRDVPGAWLHHGERVAAVLPGGSWRVLVPPP